MGEDGRALIDGEVCVQGEVLVRLKIMTDGGSRGNPGPAGAGVVIKNDQGSTVFAGGFYLGTATNNVAEYEGLVRALDVAEELGASELDVLCDSELLVKQVNGQYRVKNAKLRVLYEQAVAKIEGFDRVSVGHVFREANSQADGLANRAMDSKADVGGMAGRSGDVVSEGEAGGERFAAVRDLTDVRVAEAGGVHREVLGEEDGLKTVLVSLDGGQRCRLRVRASAVMVTVVQGAGSVKSGGEARGVKGPCWLHVRAAGELEVVAEADERLVLLVTGGSAGR